MSVGPRATPPTKSCSMSGGARYIDDLVLNRLDADNDGDYTDAGSYTHYALTDHQFSVVAMISNSRRLIERVSYDAYGTAQHHWMQDVDGDGDIDANDESLTTSASGNSIYQSGYNVDADFNRDGVINSTDTAEVTSSSYAAAIRAGWLSASAVGNTIGYCGYVFNPEHGGSEGGIYTVRFRHFDPMWGRWLERDPAGYIDSMSLYGYGAGWPLGDVDPLGLKSRSKMRKEIMKREGWEEWPYDENDDPWEIDHIIPQSEGGTDDIDNLRALPKKDHIARHRAEGHYSKWGKQGAAAKAAKRAAGVLGVLVLLGLVTESEVMAQDLEILFGRLQNAPTRAQAELIAWDLAERIAALYGSSSYLLVKRFIQAWEEIEDENLRQRLRKAAEQAAQGGGGVSTPPLYSDDPEGPAGIPELFHPCYQ